MKDLKLLFLKNSDSKKLKKVGYEHLGSSLQKFDSALFSLGFGRYPDALLFCVNAIEGLLLYNYGKPSRSDITEAKLHGQLQYLMHRASEEFEIAIERFDGIRTLRNRIVHKGYSDKDDLESFKYLTLDAMPIYMRIYEKITSEDFISHRFIPYPYQSLGTHLEKTLVLCKKSPIINSALIFQYTMRYALRDNFIGPALRDFMIKQHENSHLDNYIHHWTDSDSTFSNWNHWQFLVSCPCCYEGDLECDLDFTKKGKILLSHVICFWCGLNFTEKDAPHLGETFLSGLVEKHKDEIIKEYGLENVWEN